MIGKKCRFKVRLSMFLGEPFGVEDLDFLIDAPLCKDGKQVGIFTGYDREADYIYGEILEDYVDELNQHYPTSFSVELKGCNPVEGEIYE